MSVSGGTFREPSSTILLRWGDYRNRYAWGLILIIAGTLGLQATNTYTLFYLIIATAAHCSGWAILPGRGIRRAWVVWPSLLAVWALLTGPQSLPGLTVIFVAWLIVRQRPAISYLAAIPVIVVTVALATVYREYHDLPLSLSIATVVIVGCAWLARLLAQLLARLGRTPSVARALAK